MQRDKCLAEGCIRESLTVGLCSMHYQQNIHGHANHPQLRSRRVGSNYEERFWIKVNQSGGYPDFSDPLVKLSYADDECWLWTGARGSKGYPGQFAGFSSAYRWACDYFNGSVDGLDVDHLCRNRACVNPAHLESVTRAVNVQRGLAVPPGRKRRNR